MNAPFADEPDLTVRVGVIGVGSRGDADAALIAAGDVPGLTLAALAATSDASALVRSGDIDAVVVTAPVAERARIVKEALRRGVHVLVELGLGTSLAEVQGVAAVAATTPGTSLGAFVAHRAHPAHNALKTLVADGPRGAATASAWVVPGPGGVSDLCADPFSDPAQRRLDLWQWLCGDALAVSVTGEPPSTLVDFGDGARGTLRAATPTEAGGDRLDLTTAAGPVALAVDPTTHDASLTAGEKTTAYPFDERGPRLAALRNFAEHLTLARPLLATAVDALRGARLADAVLRSVREGREISLQGRGVLA